MKVGVRTIAHGHRGIENTVHGSHTAASMCDDALYERVKFSQGQKLPLVVGAGEARIFNDITPEQVVAALHEWEARCA